MTNPWDTGESYYGVRISWWDAQTRISAAKSFDIPRLRECLAYQNTQKTVRQFILRRLRQLESASTPPLER